METLRLARQLPRFEMRRSQSLGEAVMWRITTRGFAFQEVLMLAAMNIATFTVNEPRNAGKRRRSSRQTRSIHAI